MFGPFPLPHTQNVESYPKSLVELRMNSLSATIREKVDWHIKRLNPNIVSRWEAEALAQGCTIEQFKYVIDELEYYDSLRSDFIEVASVDGVWRASALFPHHLKSQFALLISKLSTIPDKDKDWHPGSDNKVLDLVHPGLYLFVSGKTRTIELVEAGDPPFERNSGIPTKLPELQGMFVSAHYQWIPTPVVVNDKYQVEFLSYINNLHPTHHQDLYVVLGEMFQRTLPLFERVLGFLKSPLQPKIDLRDFQIYSSASEPEQEEDETDSDYDNRLEEWWDRRRPLNPIPIPTFTKRVLPLVSLRSCRLQVIVKIQEIQLTPERPTYDGGVWHVEGMENERIVATAIYYYECSNITESTLSFRQAVCEPEYEQNDDRGMNEVYGLSNEAPLVQELGSVVTKPGLVLAWPNLYQHRVSSFELLDKSKPGKRGILVFFLVDPDRPMTYDTLTVPPQQKDWWVEKLEQSRVLCNLPYELRTTVFRYVDDPMPIEVAKEHRQRSMDERKYIHNVVNEAVFEREFSLCEH